MLSLHKLEVFITVVEAGSFSAAAERLYLTQSAVSQHMHDLESSLGVRLFERGPRGVRLTPAGETLRDYTRSILGLLAEAENAVADVSGMTSGQMRVGATPGVSGYLLPGWIQAFRARYPRLLVSLTTGVTDEVAAGLLSRALDIGLIEGELMAHPAVRLLELEAVRQWVVVGRGHPWYGRAEIYAAELNGQALIMRPSQSQSRLWLNRILAERDVAPVVAAELDSVEAIKQAVIAGMGIAVLPEYIVNREREQGLLSLLAVSDAPFERSLKLAWDQGRPFSPVTRAFLTLLAERFPALSSLTPSR
ncbi:MAG: LysR family transcriptional regulator [Anaerolineae bacterium]|nr:LysR family transcriptional regulator [Anaerolineae bacterium]